MSDYTFFEDDLRTVLPKASYSALTTTVPSAIPVIAELIYAGESPDDIYKAALKFSNGSEFIAGVFQMAAERIQSLIREANEAGAVDEKTGRIIAGEWPNQRWVDA